MFTDLLINHCSPTLAGIKTGSIFTCRCDDKNEVICRIRYLNNRYRKRGILFLLLHFNRGNAVVYAFRPSMLKKDFADAETAEILKDRGYPVENIYKSIGKLMKNMYESREFPHEIGLFLGYPAGDVKGFIDNRADNYIFSGMWKVYSDADRARTLFRKYHICRDCYCRNFRQFLSIDQLIVAV